MNKKIKWYNFSEDEPGVLNEYYLVEDVAGCVYIDQWIHKPFKNWEGNIIENKWEDTHRAYVERWAEIDGISLREYVELSRN